MWKEFHKYWIDYGNTHNVPIYFMRYEDLKKQSVKKYEELFRFVFGVDSL
jgi:hypothetical protein